MGTWATRRLDDLVAGAEPPPVVRTLQLGTLDSWGAGWVRKRWEPTSQMFDADGSLFGGLIAALADQVLAFAAMTVVPGDRLFGTTNLVVSFSRVGRDHAVDIDAKVVAQSRQLIHVRAEFRGPGDELLAEASARQVLQGFG